MRLVYQRRSDPILPNAVVARAEFIAELPNHAREIDPVGLATVLLLGFPLGRRTVLRGVDAVAPDAPDGAVDSYGLKPCSRPPGDAELKDLFLDALRRELPDGPTVLMLSGGRDSRLILLGLRALGRLPAEVITTGDRGDRAVARRLAQRFGLPFHEVEPATFSAAREAERHRRLSYSSLEHQWMFAAAERVRSRGLPITDGIGAGVLPTGSFLKPEVIAMWEGRRYDEIADWAVGHCNGVGLPMFEALRGSGLPIAGVDEVRHEFVGVLRSLEGWPNPLGTLSLLHWTGRGIAASAFGLIGGGRRIVAPFFDRALCEALMAVETREAVRTDWRDTLLRAFDDSGVPLAPSDAPTNRMPIVHRMRSAMRWRSFVGGLSPAMQAMAAATRSAPLSRLTFQRTAISLLAALGVEASVR